jgi:hypothetical protein
MGWRAPGQGRRVRRSRGALRRHPPRRSGAGVRIRRRNTFRRLGAAGCDCGSGIRSRVAGRR